MLLLLLSWILLFFIFLSYGELLIRVSDKVLKDNTIKEYTFLDKFWIGILFIIMISILINFFAPLNLIILAIFLILALVLNLYYKIPIFVFKEIASFCSKHKSLSICFGIIVITLLAYSLYPNYIYDTALYHIQTMKWYQEYAIVPGLGNLHGRLAFNSTSLIIYEVFNYQIGIFNGFTSLSGVCILVFVAWCFVQISKLRFISSIFLVFICSLFILSFATLIASYNTDLLPALLTLILVTNFIFSENRWNKPLFFLCVPLLSITFKTSSISICLLALVFFIYYFKNRSYRKLFFCTTIGSFLIIPWLARFVIETGYLIYPFPSIDIFSFDWKMPIDMVIKEKASIVAYARMPGFDIMGVTQMLFSEWFPIFYFKLNPLNSFFFLLALLSPLIVLFNYTKTKFNNNVLICWVIVFVGVLFSIATAPATRFHFAFVVATASLPFLLLQDKSHYDKKGYFKSSILVYFILLGIVGIWFLKIALWSIFSDYMVPTHLFGIWDLGFLEKRSFQEIFYAEYAYKSIGLVTTILGILIAVFIYRNIKLKSIFQNLINMLCRNKNFLIMSACLFFAIISLLHLRYNYVNDGNRNLAALLIAPQEPILEKPRFEIFQLNGTKEVSSPINSDRCYDCDLPCTPYYSKHLELRGPELSDGFRMNKEKD